MDSPRLLTDNCIGGPSPLGLHCPVKLQLRLGCLHTPKAFHVQKNMENLQRLYLLAFRYPLIQSSSQQSLWGFAGPLTKWRWRPLYFIWGTIKFLSNGAISKLANFANSILQPNRNATLYTLAFGCLGWYSPWICFLRHEENNWFSLPREKIGCTKISGHFLHFALWFWNGRFHWTLIRPSKEHYFFSLSFPTWLQRTDAFLLCLTRSQLARNLRPGLYGDSSGLPWGAEGTAF